MPNVILPNLGIELPDVGSDQDTWGDILNADLQILDNAVQYDVISKTLSNVDVTLTAAEAASAVINLTGTLTANVNVIVPATPVRVYLVRNQTSGAFTVTVKTAAGTGTPVQQGTSSLVYSDGTNIIQGATSVNGSFAVSGAFTAGSINSTPIGATTPSTGGFTNLAYTGTLTGGTGVVDIGSGQIYKDAAGSVGIGTATPQARLNVRNEAGDAFTRMTSGSLSGIEMGNGAVGNAARIYYNSNLGALVFENIQGASPVERLRIDSAGNAGLGVTPSAWNTGGNLQLPSGGNLGSAGNGLAIVSNSFFNGTNSIYITANPSTSYTQGAGNHAWFTAPSGTAGNPITFTQAMTLTQGGNLLVGGTSEAALDGVFGAVIGGTSKPNAGVALESSISQWMTYTDDSAQALRFYDARLNVERARMTPSGYFKASNTGAYNNATGAFHESRNDTNNPVHLSESTNTGSGVAAFYAILPTSATGFLYFGQTGASAVYQVLANGNVQNTNNSYGAISDAKLKNVIGPAPSYWERYKLIEWVKYILKNDPTNQEQLGVIAQQVRDIFPGLIEETPDMHEVTKTREVTKTVPVTTTETQNVKSTEIKLVNGKYVQVTTVTPTEVQVPVVDEFPVYDEAGQPVMQLVSPAVEAQDAVLDDEGNELQPAVAAQSAVYAPLMHKVSRMQTITETEIYTEMEPTGTVTLSAKYSILGHISDVVLQEAMARIEALEAR